jgi:hypothetical protein
MERIKIIVFIKIYYKTIGVFGTKCGINITGKKIN